jgi:putative solute:sodium symporter small subunit
MRAATSRPRRATDDIDEQTGIGEVYMRSLVGSQLRLALGVLGGFVVSLCGLPLLFALAPALRQVDVVGIPLPWLLLGVLAYPVFVVAAWAYVRAAERAERDFADLVERR